MDNPFKNLSKHQQYAVAGGSVLVGGYVLYKHHSSTGSWNPFSKGTSTAASAASGTGTDPITGLPYSQDTAIDPVTGEGYLAEAQQYGSVQAAEASVSAYGQSGSSGSGIGVLPANGGSSTGSGSGSSTGSGPGSAGTGPGSETYTSDAAWVQAAQAGLTDVGYNPTDVATALGDYVTNTPVTPAQKQLIDVAIAEFGPSPQDHQIILLPPSQPRTNNIIIRGLSVDKVNDATKGNNGSAQLRWDQAQGATGYRVAVPGSKGFDTDSTLANTGELKPGLHTVTVSALPHGKPASVSFTVNKAKNWKE